MSLPTFTATGYLARDPHLTYGRSRVARCSIRLHCADGEGSTVVVVDLAGDDAQRVVRTFRRGDVATATGVLEQRRNERGGAYRLRTTDLRRLVLPADDTMTEGNDR